MASRQLVRFNLNWVLAFVFCALIPVVRSQINGCSIEGILLEQCLNQGDGSFIIDRCCKALNQAVQAGFSCLCLLVASSVPLLSTPISLPLSNCLISSPPLTLCHDLAPIPVVFPPERPKELNHPPPPPAIDVLVPPPPPQAMQTPLNSGVVSNSSSAKATNQQKPDENSAPQMSFSKRENEASSGDDDTKTLLRRSLLFSLALHSLYIFCLILSSHTLKKW